MSKIEDLHTLVRLLKEFEFPVSPILEYAIKEKIGELSVGCNNQVEVLSVQEEQPKETSATTHEMTLTNTKKKPSTLRIIRADDSIIESETAAATLCKAIQEIGVKEVYDLKIPMDGMHLVTMGGNPQYPTAQHDVGNGYFVNAHSNTATKKRQLEKIITACNLRWKVEIVEHK